MLGRSFQIIHWLENSIQFREKKTSIHIALNDTKKIEKLVVKLPKENKLTINDTICSILLSIVKRQCLFFNLKI